MIDFVVRVGVWVGLLAVAACVGYAAAVADMGHVPSNIPVCSAQTEDSVITGCYYKDGFWYTK